MNKLPRGTFAVLCGVSLLLWMHPILDTFGLAAGDSKYTHILLILPIALLLIFQNLRERRIEPRTWSPGGSLLLVTVLILSAVRWAHVGGDSDVGLTIAMIALVLWWIGSVLFCFGLPTFRAFCFPLLFLFLMVPIPRTVTDGIVTGLQHGSLWAAQALFWLLRVPVVRDGTTLQIPGLDIDVTTECSSIRSSMMLLVTTIVLVHLLLATPWRRAFVVLLAVPLSIAKNGLRIVTIGLLGTQVDESYLTGHLHRQGGIIFFLIGLVGIFLLLWYLRRSEAATPQLRTKRT